MIDRRSSLLLIAKESVVWLLAMFLSLLVWVGCNSNDEYRWEPHVVPSAKPAEKPRAKQSGSAADVEKGANG